MKAVEIAKEMLNTKESMMAKYPPSWKAMHAVARAVLDANERFKTIKLHHLSALDVVDADDWLSKHSSGEKITVEVSSGK